MTADTETTRPALTHADGQILMSLNNDLAKMVRRLALKLERVEGPSLATEDARKLVDFDSVLLMPVEITEASQ